MISIMMPVEKMQGYISLWGIIMYVKVNFLFTFIINYNQKLILTNKRLD